MNVTKEELKNKTKSIKKIIKYFVMSCYDIEKNIYICNAKQNNSRNNP